MTTVDVGDAFELVFTTAVGAAVTAQWIDPAGAVVQDGIAVAEDPPASGRYPHTFQATSPGTWTARVNVTGTAVAVEEYFVFARGIPAVRPLAVTGHVAEQFGSMTPAEEGLAKALLRAASTLVRSRYPLVDEQIADATLSADLVALAVTNMVLRVMRNPKGLRAETVGPFSRTYDTTVAAGLLIITADEDVLLTPDAGSDASSRVGTLRIAGGLVPPVHHHRVRCERYARW